MKRDEMVKLIKGQLEQFERVMKTHPEYRDGHLDRFADGILALQEQFGMTPPEYEPYPGSDHSVVFRRWEDA